eukprot:4110314-Karenia_brevis.AAC.1
MRASGMIVWDPQDHITTPLWTWTACWLIATWPLDICYALSPEKQIKLVDPRCKLWQYTASWICDFQHGKNFGIEDAGKHCT